MNNPYAFPLVKPDHESQICEAGMTLLDYFAGQVLAGLETREDERTWTKDMMQSADDWRREMARNDAAYCYMMAEAMLEARAAVAERAGV